MYLRKLSEADDLRGGSQYSRLDEDSVSDSLLDGLNIHGLCLAL